MLSVCKISDLLLYSMTKCCFFDDIVLQLSLIWLFVCFFSNHSVKILLRQTRHTTWNCYVSVRLISCLYQHLLTMSNQKAQHHFPLHHRWKLLKKSWAYSLSWINLDNFHVCRFGCGVSYYECSCTNAPNDHSKPSRYFCSLFFSFTPFHGVFI